ncbi:MAG: hypothetical protein RBQ81_06835 [Arcobacteraceae bacterium]|jgi:hypothetical protein|nr:hypothetical protein [Arcobacteraceae bacterium]
MKYLIIFALCLTQLYGVKVGFAKQNIGYKEIVTKEHFIIKEINSTQIPRNCEVFDLNLLDKREYFASKYIKEGSMICTKDLKEYEKKEIIFNFGALEIRTDGEVIHETDEYITIKKHDGSVQKIFKDGRGGQ